MADHYTEEDSLAELYENEKANNEALERTAAALQRMKSDKQAATPIQQKSRKAELVQPHQKESSLVEKKRSEKQMATTKDKQPLGDNFDQPPVVNPNVTGTQAKKTDTPKKKTVEVQSPSLQSEGGAVGQRHLLGSIKPSSKLMRKTDLAYSQQYTNEGYPSNHEVKIEVPKNPLQLDKASLVKPATTELPRVQLALQSVMRTGGAFDTNTIKVDTDERDGSVKRFSVKTETGYDVESDGLKFDLHGTEENSRDEDLDLTLEVRSMLQAAKAMGWSQLDVEGTPAFVEAAKKEAMGMDIELVTTIQVSPSPGPDPKESKSEFEFDLNKANTDSAASKVIPIRGDKTSSEVNEESNESPSPFGSRRL